MVRSQWLAAVVVGLAWTSLARTQSPPPMPSGTTAERYMTVREDGKPPQRCKLLKSWRETNGATAYQVQAVDSGEVMTIVESGPAPQQPAPQEKGGRRKVLTRIFRWGRGNKPPDGSPIPPPGAPMLQTPTPPPRFGSPTPAPMPTGYAPSQPRPYAATSLTSPVQPTGVTQTAPTGDQAGKPDLRATDSTSTPRLTPTPAGCVTCQAPCNTCCQPCGDACSPAPKKPNLISRIFHPNSTTTVAAKTTTVNAPPPTTPPVSTVQVPAPPLEPRDWRESWGKVEPWKHNAPDKGEERVEAAKTPNKPVEPLPPPKRVVQAPVQMEQPRHPNPLDDPHWYRDVAVKHKPANSKVPDLSETATPTQPPNVVVRPNTPRMPVIKQAKAPVPPRATTAGPGAVRLDGRVIDLPASEGNAFWTPETAPPKKVEAPKFNAFDRSQQAQQPPMGQMPMMAGAPMGQMPMVSGVPMGQMPMPMAMPPRMAKMPPAIDSGVPSGMGNAFTLAGTRRPIPADFGPTPQEPNGFGDYDLSVAAQAAAMPPRANMPPQMPGMPGMPMTMPRGAMMPANPYMAVPSSPMQQMNLMPSASSASVPQMMLTLKDSLYPSQRESAAEQMGELNWRLQPQVVQSLTRAAREDPAPTVRSACVRALTRMKADTLDVLETMRSLKNDGDAQVRHEAEEALVAISAGSMLRQDSGIRQASHP